MEGTHRFNTDRLSDRQDGTIHLKSIQATAIHHEHIIHHCIHRPGDWTHTAKRLIPHHKRLRHRGVEQARAQVDRRFRLWPTKFEDHTIKPWVIGDLKQKTQSELPWHSIDKRMESSHVLRRLDGPDLACSMLPTMAGPVVSSGYKSMDKFVSQIGRKLEKTVVHACACGHPVCWEPFEKEKNELVWCQLTP